MATKTQLINKLQARIEEIVDEIVVDGTCVSSMEVLEIDDELGGLASVVHDEISEDDDEGGDEDDDDDEDEELEEEDQAITV